MVKGVDIEYDVPEALNLTSYLVANNIAEGRGDKPAVYCQNAVYTYNDLCRLIDKAGSVLKGLGVEPENRVLLILQDSPEWLASWFGTIKIGGVGTHAYTYLRAKDYKDFLELVRPKVVVADETTLDEVREAIKGCRFPKAVLISSKTSIPLRENEYHLQGLMEGAPTGLEAEPTQSEDIAFWNFSGGTTGKPKAVPHTHRDGLIAFKSFQYIFNYKPEDVILRVPKLFFHYSRDLGMQFPLGAGSAVILFPERTTPRLIFNLIGQYKPTVLINVPTMMREMLQTPVSERSDLSCIHTCMSSGEFLSAELYTEWVKTFGGEVSNRFGSAESCMGYLCNRPGAVVPGSSGTVVPMAEVKLVNDAGAEVLKGEPGVLLARCPANGLLYVRETEKSRRTFLSDGWLNTGDLFVQDEKDYFWYRGRGDDMVKVSGVWVSPLEIERCLEKHPSVKECVVLGIEGKDKLTTTKAYIALHAGTAASQDTANELKEFCKKQLAPYKFPRLVEFLPELPKTGQGKIDKRLLRSSGE
jgi:benzoate-CoA ligase family protein